MEANRGGEGAARALCVVRGAARRFGEAFPAALEFAIVAKQGRQLRRDVEEEKCDNPGFRG
jgi:hypothetical protein